MATFCENNPTMDIATVIATNLAAWMNANPDLDTLQKVEKKSGVGFGTIRRTRNGEGNITVDKISAIAEAFGRTAADLLMPEAYDKGLTSSGNGQNSPRAVESVPAYSINRWPFPHVSQSAYQALDDAGQVWVQARTAAAIDEATRQFGTQSGKRTA